MQELMNGIFLFIGIIGIAGFLLMLKDRSKQEEPEEEEVIPMLFNFRIEQLAPGHSLFSDVVGTGVYGNPTYIWVTGEDDKIAFIAPKDAVTNVTRGAAFAQAE